MVTRDNGILTQAQTAKEETEKASENEVSILSNYERYINSSLLDTAKVGEIVTDEKKEI